ncbi:unnamed protein product [Toxocara canis]|uniref:Uncharacterized protein n=1 Tax=Toxocara canis TaxID=6265 RepID=A0A183UQ97_TOXCA|nr:unnamed protein product [Toxocara canis]
MWPTVAGRVRNVEKCEAVSSESAARMRTRPSTQTNQCSMMGTQRARVEYASRTRSALTSQQRSAIVCCPAATTARSLLLVARLYVVV